jgi:Tol biopolymer transport system component
MRFMRHTLKELSTAILNRGISSTSRGQAKVLDFGLAKLLENEEHDGDTNLTITGAVMGTPAAMSPEQARGEQVDHRSDIFSFGVVLYEMATGSTPFAGRSKADVISAVLNEQHTPAIDLNKELPQKLSSLIDRALAKEPKARYQSMAELIVDLRQVVTEVGALDRLFSSSDPPHPVVPFVRPARATHVGADSSSVPPVTNTKSWWRLPFVWVSVSLSVVLMLTVAYGYWRYKKQTNPNSSSTFAFAQATSKQLTTKGNVRWAALSPDGKFYAYVLTERDDRSESLWLGQIDASNDIQLRPPAGRYEGLTFSPDGKALYFTFRDQSQGGLFRMHLLGGVAEKLADNVRDGFTLSSDGKRIAFLRPSKQIPAATALVVANLQGTEELELMTRPPDKNFAVNCMAWSPDGSMLATAAINDSEKVSREIFSVRIADRHVEQLTKSEWTRVSNLVWQRDGQGLIIVGANNNETLRHLWHIEYPGGTLHRLAHDTDGYGTSLSISGDGNSLMAVQVLRESNIWIAPTNDLSKLRQVSFSSMYGLYGWEGMDWTPDNDIVFTAGIDRSIAIYSMKGDGSNIKQLTSAGYLDQKPKVTGDGRFIVFQSNRSGSNEIWRVQPDGNGLVQLTTGGGNSAPDSTPDGKWVIYVAAHNDKTAVWRISIDGGQPLELIDKPASDVSISPDGELLACAYKEDNGQPWKLAVLELKTGTPRKLFTVSHFSFNDGIRWMPDGRAIVYRHSERGLWRQDLDGGKPIPIEGIPDELIYRFNYSRDGKLFAFARGRVISDVVLMRDQR